MNTIHHLLSGIILAMTSLATAPASYAQDLKHEITVEHEIVPLHREAARLNLTPQFNLPPLSGKGLDYSARTLSARVTPSFDLLDPAGLHDSIPIVSQLGYVGVSYAPYASGALSAGIRAIDTRNSKLGIRLQGCADNYRSEMFGKNNYPILDYIDNPARFNIRRYDMNLAADMAVNIGNGRNLTVDAAYKLHHYHLYSWQTANNPSINIGFSSPYNDLFYNIDAGFSHFGLVRGQYPIRENVIKLNGTLGTRVGSEDKNLLALDVRFCDIMDNHNYYRYADGNDASLAKIQTNDDANSYSHGLLTLRPSFSIYGDNITATIGAKVEMTFHNGKFLHIAPDVTIDWRPAQSFCLYGGVTGGEIQNTAEKMFDINHYAIVRDRFNNSHIPFAGKAGMTVGPIKGAWIRLEGAYAAINDMPITVFSYDYFIGNTTFVPVDLRGWRVTAEAGFTLGDLVTATATFSHAPGDVYHSWYQWADRASNVFDVRISSKPVEKLNVNAGYELRTGRYRMVEQTPDPAIKYFKGSLCNISRLNVGATYNLTESLGTGLDIDLPLKKALTLGGVYEHGFRVSVGASYKF